MSTISRETVVAGEQKAVDRAYDCYEARLAELTEQSPASAAASGKDAIAARKEAEARAEAYGGLGGEALVVSRVDVQEPGAMLPETFYVGRRSVSDTRTRDQVVVLWTTELAKRWYNAQPETPGEVLLRRQLRCAERTVEDYFDEIATVQVPGDQGAAAPGTRDDTVVLPRTADDGIPETAPAGDPAPSGVPSPREVVRRRRKKPLQVDEFLLRELHRSRSGRMRDIVETIRRDQMALVTGSPADVLVIQGGPGTGKSAVGLHRVTWLVNNDHFRAQDILVVGPHQNFLEYVGRVLPTLGTRNVNAVQLARLWEGRPSVRTPSGRGWSSPTTGWRPSYGGAWRASADRKRWMPSPPPRRTTRTRRPSLSPSAARRCACLAQRCSTFSARRARALGPTAHAGTASGPYWSTAF